jgi:hypothetical protein
MAFCDVDCNICPTLADGFVFHGGKMNEDGSWCDELAYQWRGPVSSIAEQTEGTEANVHE